MHHRRGITVERFLHIVLVSAIVVLSLFLLNAVRDVLLPFVVGLAIAYLMYPFMMRVQRVLRLRALAALFTAFLALFVIGGLVWLIADIIALEVQELRRLLGERLTPENLMNEALALEHQVLGTVDPEELKAMVSPERLQELGQKAVPGFLKGVSGVLGVLATLGTIGAVALYTFFILMDQERIIDGIRSLFPSRSRGLLKEVVQDLARDLNIYFRGQFLVSMGLAVVYATGFKLIGLPVGIGIGILAGLLNMVPYMAILSIVPATFSAALMSLDTGDAFTAIMAQVLIVYAVAIVMDNMVLTPRILGKATGLPPAMVLLALSVWGSLMGLLGMILALPFTTVLIAYLKRYVLEPAPQDGTTSDGPA